MKKKPATNSKGFVGLEKANNEAFVQQPVSIFIGRNGCDSVFTALPKKV